MAKSLDETDHSTFKLSLSFVLFYGTIDDLSLFHIEFKGGTGDENCPAMTRYLATQTKMK